MAGRQSALSRTVGHNDLSRGSKVSNATKSEERNAIRLKYIGLVGKRDHSGGGLKFCLSLYRHHPHNFHLFSICMIMK